MISKVCLYLFFFKFSLATNSWKKSGVFSSVSKFRTSFHLTLGVLIYISHFAEKVISKFSLEKRFPKRKAKVTQIARGDPLTKEKNSHKW